MVDDWSEHMKEKGVNESDAATISHNKYKDVLLNNKCLRNLMKRVQSKNNKIGTYEINKIPFHGFMIKFISQTMHSISYQLAVKLTVILIAIQNKLFVNP